MHSRRGERRQKKVVQPVGHLTKSCLLPESAAACLSELSSQPKDVFLVMVMSMLMVAMAEEKGSPKEKMLYLRVYS